MEPVINPFVFYLIDKVDSWASTFELIGLIGCVILVGVFIMEKVSEHGNEYEQREFEMFKSVRKFLMKICIPFALLGILLPSSNTIYKMIIADNVTPNNIQIVGDTVEDGIDYIFDKINEVVEEMEAKE